MLEIESNESYKTQLEEAERKGREEGHKKGMADILALLSAAGDGFIPDYSEECSERYYFEQDNSWIFRALVDAAMLNAAKDNEIELVKIFVKAGADINAHNGEHRTALSVAVEEGNIKMVEGLLKAGADPNHIYFADEYDDDYDYVSPLEYAVKQGHVELVKSLLAGGADLHNNGAPEGRWLIDYHAEGDQIELTRALIEAGAYLGQYIDEHDRFWTPLMQAVRYGKTKSAALLIQAGCDINANSQRGVTALMLAACRGKEEDLDIIRLLLKAGAEINHKANDGETALICAAEDGRSDAVRLLLSAGTDVFYRTPSRPEKWGRPAAVAGNAFDRATYDIVKEIIKNEMHRRIAAALSVMPLVHVDVRQKIIQLLLEDSDLEESDNDSDSDDLE